MRLAKTATLSLWDEAVWRLIKGEGGRGGGGGGGGGRERERVNETREGESLKITS